MALKTSRRVWTSVVIGGFQPGFQWRERRKPCRGAGRTGRIANRVMLPVIANVLTQAEATAMRKSTAQAAPSPERDAYEDGALEVEDTAGTRDIRLNAGDLVLYPSTTLHRVAPATRGERLAVVGRVESWIRDVGAGKILIDLDQAIATSVESAVVDRLGKVLSYLLQRWAGR